MVSAAPGNFRSTITGTTVRLDWNPLIEPVTSFLIEAGSATTLANLARLNTGNPAPSLTVTDVPSGVYFVRVRAIGPDGIPGPASNEIVVAVGGPTCSTAPAAPTGVTAQIAVNQVTLSWTASAGGCASTYVVEAGSAPALSNIVVYNTGSAATQLMANAPNGTYYVRLRGQNASGLGPASSEIIVITPGDSTTQGLDCIYTVSPANVTVVAGGAEFQVNVNTSTSNCTWSARSDSGFISLTSGASVTGSGAARFSVGANNTGPSRPGTVSISWAGGGQTVNVTQEPTPTGGGGGGGTPTTTTVPPCVYSVSPNSLTLSHTSSAFSATVTTTRADCSWTATGAGIVSVAPPSQFSGGGTARFTVLSNSTTAPRTATARVSWPGGGQDIAVMQDGQPPAPSIPTPPFTTQPMQPGGGTSQPDPTPPPPPCGVRANACGIPIGSTQGTQSSADTVTIPIASSTGQAFDGAIVTNDLSFSGGTPQSSTHLVVTFPSPRTTATLVVTLPPTTQALALEALALQVGLTSNSQPPFNYVAVELSNPCVYSLSAPTPPLSSGSGTFDVTVTASPPSCSWSTTAVPSFVSVVTGSGTGTGTARFSFTANAGTTSRSGSLTIAGQTIAITQAGLDCTALTLTPPSGTLSSSAGSFNVGVSIPAGCTWSASSLSPFISVTTGAGTGPGTAVFAITANPSTTSTRPGTVQINGQNVNVSQAAAPPPNCPPTASPATVPVTFSGGQFSVAVTIPAGCTWTATTQDSFITIVSGSPGTGTGTLTFNVAASSTTRLGTIRIASASGIFDVRIAQGQCTYTTSTSRTVTGAAQSFSVAITVTAPSPLTPTDCAPWSAASQSSFMTVPNPGPFTGSSSTSVDITANNTGASRVGTIRISFGGSGFDITVTQLVCSYTVSPLSFPNVPGTGQTIDVNVSTGSGCTWSASSLSAFIVLGSGSPGNGSGTARFTVQANPGGTRSGSVRISWTGASQDVTVTQAAGSLEDASGGMAVMWSGTP